MYRYLLWYIGHGGWVTCMQVGEVEDAGQKKEFLITGSRDKSLMIWDIQEKGDTDADKEWGVPRKVFKGKPYIYDQGTHILSI